MKVTLSYEPWGYKNVDAVIDSVGVDYHYDETHNCGVFHPNIACYVGKYRMTFNGPINWETLVIKPCKKINVKDLRVGDVIDRGNQRGIVTYIHTDGVNIHWFVKGSKHNYTMSYFEDLNGAEIVEHVNLWNL